MQSTLKYLHGSDAERHFIPQTGNNCVAGVLVVGTAARFQRSRSLRGVRVGTYRTAQHGGEREKRCDVQIEDQVAIVAVSSYAGLVKGPFAPWHNLPLFAIQLEAEMERGLRCGGFWELLSVGFEQAS